MKIKTLRKRKESRMKSRVLTQATAWVLMPFTKMDIIRKGNFGGWSEKEIKSVALAVNFDCCDTSLKRCHIGIGTVRPKI